MTHTKKPDQLTPIRLEHGLRGDAAGAVDGHDPHTLTHPEDLILFDGLYIGAHGAVVFSHGDFHALGAGETLFGRGADQATGHRTDDRRDCTAATATDTTTGHSTHHRTGTGADRRLGTLDLHRPQRFDSPHAHRLHRAGFIARIAVTREAGRTTTQGQSQCRKNCNQRNWLTHENRIRLQYRAH